MRNVQNSLGGEDNIFVFKQNYTLSLFPQEIRTKTTGGRASFRHGWETEDGITWQVFQGPDEIVSCSSYLLNAH
jgi:hypothetical protein